MVSKQQKKKKARKKKKKMELLNLLTAERAKKVHDSILLCKYPPVYCNAENDNHYNSAAHIGTSYISSSC